ncbi:4741_t:CDS:2, partial [Racocetra persica]
MTQFIALQIQRGELASSCGKYSDNPILLIHPHCDCSYYFNDFVTSPYVVKKYSTGYLKPFDVVETDMKLFEHVGVYLGKIDGEFKVCHFTRKKNNTTIDNWNDFFQGRVIGCHPIVPFNP